jgi:dTDP-4-dehydrorhamnose reductase
LRVLILGASGMIGHRMWATLGERHEAIGVLRRTELGPLASIPGIDLKNAILGIEIQNISKLTKIIEETKPDIVLNCIGIVKQLKDSSDHLKSITLNALFPHQLAKVCADNNARMIQFSSDCVFDGKKGYYKESDLPNDQDLYGRTKAMGEVDYLKNVLTMRTSSIGREVFPHGGLIEWFIGNSGKSITGYKKAIYSGFPSKRLGNIIADYIIPNSTLSGIVHVAGTPIDKFSLLNMIKDHFQLKIEILANDQVSIERSLNYEHFSKITGFVAPSWKEMMKDLEVDFEIYESIRKKYV